MARLPDSLDVGAPRGARLSGDTVRPTDFGLGDVAGAVEQVGQALATRDDRDAEKIIRNAQGPVETRFAELAAGYDGRESGFANKALASFENHFTAVTEDTSYSEGVRSAVRRRLDDYRADFGRRAIGVESQRRAGIVAEQVKVKEEARLGDVAIGFNTAFSAKYQARVDSFDGSDRAGRRPGRSEDPPAVATERPARAGACAGDGGARQGPRRVRGQECGAHPGGAGQQCADQSGGL
jgi:hypothetical protein